MIFSTARLIAAGMFIAVLIGAYLKGRHDGAEVVQAAWTSDSLIAAEAFQQAVADKELVEDERDAALKEIADELKPKLTAADASVAGLARRLRLAATSASRCPVPGDPGPAGGDHREPERVHGGFDEVERDLDAAGAAGLRTEHKLKACIAAYGAVRQRR
jgi:hypothetical protein